nr:hypothetical protein [uncultured bacterium]
MFNLEVCQKMAVSHVKRSTSSFVYNLEVCVTYFFYQHHPPRESISFLCPK